ncbi:unnamed protein product [Cylicostephanus goldi]|uniref:Uncharacterized protein n=1 Tax=Cylicostephanus goldi TaxID=71465 RepID=A0A3P6QQ14_CYLGO|nr:unnamed protein product [Cylicostephanus goldi]
MELDSVYICLRKKRGDLEEDRALHNPKSSVAASNMPSNAGFLSDVNFDRRMLIEGGVAALINGNTLMDSTSRTDSDGDSMSSSDDDSSSGHCHCETDDDQREVKEQLGVEQVLSVITGTLPSGENCPD